jgi:alkylation response protein AidB-like acyl-CoA dehydrogenase
VTAVQLASECAQRFAKRAEAYDRDAAFPGEDVDDLRDARLLGLLVPERLGGMGAGFETYTEVATTLAHVSGASARVFNMHAAVTGALATIPEDLARQLGVPEAFFSDRDRLLADAAAGALYGVAITEREAGGRLSAMRTTFAPEGDGYRLRGHKAVCTGAGHLDGYLVAARAADGTDEAPRVSYFLVPASDGLTVEPTWDPLGMRATASNGFRIDTHVPAEALIGRLEGLAVLLAYAMPQWLVASYASVYVGVAEAILAEAVAHIGSRSVAGHSGGLARIGFIRARLGRAEAQVAAARLVLREAGRSVDARPVDPETVRWVYRAKLLAGEAATEVATSCTEACGLGVLRRGAVLERLFRDARSGAVMPPSSDVCADVLGTAALGLDPVTGSDVRPW